MALASAAMQGVSERGSKRERSGGSGRGGQLLSWPAVGVVVVAATCRPRGIHSLMLSATMANTCAGAGRRLSGKAEPTSASMPKWGARPSRAPHPSLFL